MANIIKIKRGLSEDVNSLVLLPGELAVALDNHFLYVGDNSGATQTINANKALSLSNPVSINGVSFDGTSNITIPAEIEAGDHIQLTGETINVIDIGDLSMLLTTDQDTLVSAINELVGKNNDVQTSVVTLTNETNTKTTALDTRIKNLETNGINSVGTLTNNLMTLNKTAATIGTDSTPIQTKINGDVMQVEYGDDKLLSIGVKEETGVATAEMSRLDVSTYITAGNHRQQKFEINGEKRTGWFYIGGDN